MLRCLVDTWLASRRANGFVLRHYERDLYRFAEFAAERSEDHIRTETAIAWAGQAGTPAQRCRRFGRIVQLARYLHAEDDRHEIPSAGVFPSSRRRPVPYIYTAQEARRLIAAAERLGPTGSLRPRTTSTVLALLFATGLRISEALALRTRDVTPDGLVIAQTKFGKSRLVPLHPSAQEGLAQYLDCRQAPPGGTVPVFVNTVGAHLSYDCFRRAWLVVLERAGLSARADGRRPRVHDIRHTFAVRALETAPDQRDRITKHMLAVSTYLGHRCVADTYWYFQATPTLMTQVADACQGHFESARP